MSVESRRLVDAGEDVGVVESSFAAAEDPYRRWLIRLNGESLDRFSDRLLFLGAKMGRWRSCSLGWHDECSDTGRPPVPPLHRDAVRVQTCACPCHRADTDVVLADVEVLADPLLRRFELITVDRDEKVAEGVAFSDGSTVVRWVECQVTDVYGSIADLEDRYGHGLVVWWLDKATSLVDPTVAVADDAGVVGSSWEAAASTSVPADGAPSVGGRGGFP